MRDRQEYEWQALRRRSSLPRWRVKVGQWIRRWSYRLGFNL